MKIFHTVAMLIVFAVSINCLAQPVGKTTQTFEKGPATVLNSSNPDDPCESHPICSGLEGIECLECIEMVPISAGIFWLFFGGVMLGVKKRQKSIQSLHK